MRLYSLEGYELAQRWDKGLIAADVTKGLFWLAVISEATLITAQIACNNWGQGLSAGLNRATIPIIPIVILAMPSFVMGFYAHDLIQQVKNAQNPNRKLIAAKCAKGDLLFGYTFTAYCLDGNFNKTLFKTDLHRLIHRICALAFIIGLTYTAAAFFCLNENKLPGYVIVPALLGLLIGASILRSNVNDYEFFANEQNEAEAIISALVEQRPAETTPLTVEDNML